MPQVPNEEPQSVLKFVLNFGVDTYLVSLVRLDVIILINGKKQPINGSESLLLNQGVGGSIELGGRG